MERHPITLLDGREFESCSEEEAKVAEAWFFVYGTYYRLKKKEPRTFEGTIASTFGAFTKVIVVTEDWAPGTKVQVTEVVE